MEREVVIYVVKFDGNVVVKFCHHAKLSKLGLNKLDLEKATMLAEDDCALVLAGNILMAVYEEGTIEEAVVIGICENSSGYVAKE